MSIREICHNEVYTVYENSTISDAAKLMAEQDTGFLVVTGRNDLAPIGSITDRDIVVRSIAIGQDPTESKVSGIMAGDLLTLDENQGTQESIEIMSEKKVRYAPVVSNNRVIGLVSMDDLFSMLAKEINTLAGIPRKQIHLDEVTISKNKGQLYIDEALTEESQ